ncbi:MAG: hypothetical protein KGN02_04745 [bacterium]|nr:hypothetical protein [bacterium]
MSLLIAVAEPPALDWHPEPTAYAAACGDAVTRYRGSLEAIARTQSPSLASIVLPLERAQADLDDATATAPILEHEAAAPDLREAARTCRESARTADETALADPRLFHLLQRVFHGRWARTPIERSLGLRWRSLLVASGGALAPQARRALLVRRAELDAIEADYAEHPDEMLFARAAAARDRLAHLLGYESWAERALAPTSLRTPAAAEKLVERILAEPTAQPHSLDPAPEALPLAGLPDDILAVDAAFLGLRVTHSDLAGWSPSVRVFDVNDAASGDPIGTLALDFDADDPRGAQLLVPRRDDGTGTHAAYAVVRMRYPAPRRGGTMLARAQVAALADELGTALASLVPDTAYERLNDVSPDVSRITGALFADLFPRARDERAELASDAHVASLDLRLAQGGSGADARMAWRALAPAQRAVLVRDAGLVSARNVLARLYAADIAADLGAEPIAQEVGRRYRRLVLEPGGALPVLDELTRFLGRPPDLERLYTPDAP